MSLEGIKNTQLSAQFAKPFIYSPTTFEEAYKFAEMISKSDLAPKDYRGKPENTFVAMQLGAEVGLHALQSLQNISVINGRPSIWGDAAIALVRASPDCAAIKEWEEGSIKGGDWVAFCEAKNKKGEVCFRKFSMEDAQRAGLWNKQGTWQQYPGRMLQMRARGFSLRDLFPHVLKGLYLVEEAIDLPKEDYSVLSVRDINKAPGLEGLQSRLAALNTNPEEPIRNPEQSTHENNEGQKPFVSYEEIEMIIKHATCVEDLEEAADCARELPEEQKTKIRKLYKNKMEELKNTGNVANT